MVPVLPRHVKGPRGDTSFVSALEAQDLQYACEHIQEILRPQAAMYVERLTIPDRSKRRIRRQQKIKLTRQEASFLADACENIGRRSLSI